MVYDSSRRGVGRVNDYGVVTVSKPCANVIVLGKYDFGKITVSFHYALQVVQRYIQEQLGHNHSKTTEIYTHVSTKSLGKIQSLLDSLNLKKGGSN